VLRASINTLPPEAAVAGEPNAAPASVFTEDFESYAAGMALHGQGGWKGWNNNPAAGATVSTEFACSGSQSVEILGSSDLVHEFRRAGGQWALSLMQYIPSGSTGTSNFILLNRYKDGGANTYDDWSIETQYNLQTGVITCWHGAIPGAAAILFDQWVQIKLLINLDQNTFEEFYNGRRMAAGPWDDDTHGTLQALDLFGNRASSIYYDDIRIDAYHTYTAQNPTPADGATGIALPVFRWTAGDTALFHDVYLGQTPALTAGNKVASRLSYPLYYHLAGIEPGVTYYWRVDEIEPTGTTHPGNVWSFTSAGVSTPSNPVCPQETIQASTDGRPKPAPLLVISAQAGTQESRGLPGPLPSQG
jgi:hypothetical protein